MGQLPSHTKQCHLPEQAREAPSGKREPHERPEASLLWTKIVVLKASKSPREFFKKYRGGFKPQRPDFKCRVAWALVYLTTQLQMKTTV